MKKSIAFFLIFVLCFTITACSDADVSNDRGISNDADITNTTDNSNGTESLIEPTMPQLVSYGVADFEELLNAMPVFIASVKYVVQDDEYKSLYPDMLQAVIQNDTSHDIKNALVAFVAWDDNNLPVKIKGSIDFSGGSYIKEVNYSDINLIPGEKFGESSGFEVDENCNIKTFKAIVVSYEAFDGTTWENPYYDEWCNLYEGVKYDNSLTVDIEVKNEPTTNNTTVKPETSTKPAITEDKLLSEIDSQELKVVKTKYVVQDDNYKSLYPDMLQAVIQNDTSYDIKNALVAFVAWDNNNLPVKIKGSIDFSDGSYIKEVNYNDINLIPGEKYGESSGFEVDENCNIKTFKAIVVSYETFDGTTWENPLYDDWCNLYNGIKLQ